MMNTKNTFHNLVDFENNIEASTKELTIATKMTKMTKITCFLKN